MSFVLAEAGKSIKSVVGYKAFITPRRILITNKLPGDQEESEDKEETFLREIRKNGLSRSYYFCSWIHRYAPILLLYRHGGERTGKYVINRKEI